LVGDRPLLLGCWTVGLPLSLDLRMGTDPDEALWDIGQLFKDLKQQKQQVRRTARAGPFSPKPLSPSELTIDRYLTCPPLPEGLPWIQLINRPLPKSVFPKSPSSPPSAISSSSNATTRSQGLLFIFLILRLVLRSYAAGFRWSRIEPPRVGDRPRVIGVLDLLACWTPLVGESSHGDRP
jgi:hypothetical protein